MKTLFITYVNTLEKQLKEQGFEGFNQEWEILSNEVIQHITGVKFKVAHILADLDLPTLRRPGF